MNENNVAYAENNNTGLDKNQASLTILFQILVDHLHELQLTGKQRKDILNIVQRLASEEKGKIFIRLLPYLNLKTGSYRELAQLSGFSVEQIRTWVKQYAPELFLEKSRKGAKKV